MLYMGGWAVRVLDLVGSTSWQSSWWPAWMRADRPLPGASANESDDPTPRLRGEQLLMIDRLELRRSRTSLERAHRTRLRPGLRPVQIWVTDLVAEAFAAEADRQSRLVAADEHAEADQAFVDAVSEWPGE